MKGEEHGASTGREPLGRESSFEMDVSIAAEMTMRNGQVQLLLAAKLMMERYASAKWFASCAHRASQMMTFAAWDALALQQCATTSLLWQRFVA